MIMIDLRMMQPIDRRMPSEKRRKTVAFRLTVTNKKKK